MGLNSHVTNDDHLPGTFCQESGVRASIAPTIHLHFSAQASALLFHPASISSPAIRFVQFLQYCWIDID